MDYRPQASSMNSFEEGKTDETSSTPSTSGEEERINSGESLKKPRLESPEAAADANIEQMEQQDHSSKSCDDGSGSDQPKRSLTDTEGFVSFTKSSNDEKSSSNDDKSSTDGKESNEYNDGNIASGSSSDSDVTSDEARRDASRQRKRRHEKGKPQQTEQDEVIDLIDSNGSGDANAEKTNTSDEIEGRQALKKRRTGESPQPTLSQPSQTTSVDSRNPVSQGSGSALGRQQLQVQGVQPIQPGASLPGFNPTTASTASSTAPMRSSIASTFETPTYLTVDPASQLTWRTLLPVPTVLRKPPPKLGARSNQPRFFRLSLLNVNEFTITGLPVTFDSPPTPLTNLRAAIRQTSREHGRAVFERDKEGGGGKWRIPLGAYQAFLSFLISDPNTRVERIPQHQLQIASLERARQEKGYPSVEEVIDMGVPAGLAKALAPFQRGGVDFVYEKEGRSLIADDMGLGKTIQGIASMAMYSNEWPLLVLCPSSARYHWASECRKWLGRRTNLAFSLPIEGHDFDDEKQQDQAQLQSDESKLLDPDQVHVLTSSKDPIFPQTNTRVVVCSYGLAPTLISTGKINPGLFKCAIVDESHMLKNRSAKRTLTLIPILRSTTRCVLLSGTPALARPAELWPQLEIIGTEQHGWWENEREFMERYAKNATAQRRAELHTLLTGTVMIRRLKQDILKSLPQKIREKASVRLLGEEKRKEFKELILQLKESKGALGKIANKEGTFSSDESSAATHRDDIGFSPATPPGVPEQPADRVAAEHLLNERIRKHLEEGRSRIHSYLQSLHNQLSASQLNDVKADLEGQVRSEMETMYRKGMAQIIEHYGGEYQATERKNVLSRLYGLTGDVKVPLIVDMLDLWFADPTKGKVCVFAHHLSVLDAIAVGAKLSNDPSSTRKYIRIDGSTTPRLRQQQIDDFQSDPSIRVALLGITAAGVAVTLTASSTVWFAELFWTPALMIQAEDRAHRIGQASQVKCLYFVAKGTLDDVLWKLIEKKFQDLGEFVEGKERLKMVVHKVYKSTKELFSTFQSGVGLFDEEDEDFVEDMMNELISDEELEQDILSLGEIERNMIKEDDGDDEDAPGGEGEEDQKPSAIDLSSSPKKEDGLGKSEEAAIALSSESDSDSGKNPAPGAAVGNPTSSTQITATVAPVTSYADTPLLNCRLYRIMFPGPSIGVDIIAFQGRILVDTVCSERLQKLGPNCKPSPGDVFVTIGNIQCPVGWNLPTFRHYVRSAFARPPVSVIFAEVPQIREQFLRHRQQMQQQRRLLPPVGGPSEVIEIDDSDNS